MENIFIVVPTVRDLSFLSEWNNQFAGCSLVVVEDRPRKTLTVPKGKLRAVYQFAWEDIDRDFGTISWIFPRRNAGIRSYGFWKAAALGADSVITLDDDCYPTADPLVRGHTENLHSSAPQHWYPTFPHPRYMFTRGFPYGVRRGLPVVISHGLWSHKMDMDAKTELHIGRVSIAPYPPLRQFVPRGYFFPMSSMNLAFARKATPLMYFPLMGADPGGSSWGVDRYDDIWAGLFVKKIADHLGWGITNGSPFVEHRKASRAQDNLRREAVGMKLNETLWPRVDRVVLGSRSPAGAYRELATKIVFPRNAYFRKLRQAMLLWADLWRSFRPNGL